MTVAGCRYPCGLPVVLRGAALVAAAVLSLPASAQGAPVEKPGAVTVVLAGDLMLARRLNPPTPTQVRKVRSLLGHADLIIGNLETPLGPCLDPGTPEFPRLCASKEMIEALPELGFSGVSLANNHMFDAGQSGLRQTRRMVRRLGMAATRPLTTSRANAGCPRSESVQVNMLSLKGRRVVLLAFNATVPGRPWPGFPPPVTPAQVRRCTARYARQGTVIASIHHGREYSKTPLQRDADLIRAAVRGGARIVVGHHPHVPRRSGWIEEAFVAWSLGNFASDQRHPSTHKGYLVRATLSGSLERPDLQVETVGYLVDSGWPAGFGSPAD